MQPLRFVMIGGFLGAGKTTTLARLARHHTAAGRKVALVTNDQAQDLVDTNSLRAQGFPVEEVPGACFCCKFDELIGRVECLQANEQPDVILTEPVGSCTDLVATVVQPLKDLHGDRFQVAPYGVLFKPSHGLRILRIPSPPTPLPAEARGERAISSQPRGERGRGEGGGFSPKAEYIFRKQLEEADAILVNRIDELSAEELDELSDLVTAHFPGT